MTFRRKEESVSPFVQVSRVQGESIADVRESISGGKIQIPIVAPHARDYQSVRRNDNSVNDTKNGCE